MKQRVYTDYLQDIFNSVSEIEGFIAGISREEFLRDQKTINAVIRSLEVMGEAAKKVPEAVKRKHSRIPWQKMANMRDVLVHEYFGVDLEIIWRTTKEDLPGIKPLIGKVIEKAEET